MEWRIKTNDLISFLYPKLTSVMCITEHHLKLEQLQLTHLVYYNLGACYCRQYIKIGSGNIFVQNEIKFPNFRCVLSVICFLLDNSLASEFYMQTFCNTLSHLHRQVPTCLWIWNRQSVPKLWHIKLRRWGITQKKAYNFQNTAKVWNQNYTCLPAQVRFIFCSIFQYGDKVR